MEVSYHNHQVADDLQASHISSYPLPLERTFQYRVIIRLRTCPESEFIAKGVKAVSFIEPFSH